MGRDSTVQHRFRIFTGSEGESAAAEPDRVTVPVGDIFPLLADALDDNRAWLDDFADEEITVSSDLYDVMMAYRYFHRPTA